MFEGGLEAKKPVADAMAEAKNFGFDAIELCVADQGVLTHETTQAQCEDIVAQAQKLSIEISSVASGQSWTWSPSANDPKTRAKIIDFTCKALQVTKWLGTDAYLFVPGAVDVFFLPDAEVIPYDICYQRATEAVKQILPFGSEMAGAYFDVGNVLLTGYPCQWIRILDKRIKRVHVKDFKKSVGTVEGFVDLLEGDVNFENVKKALAEIGYDGYVTAEMLPHEPGRPEKTAQAMKKIFK